MEMVQYFQFDADSNMFVFPPGSGCSGVPRLVQPGDELVFNTSDSEECSQVMLDGLLQMSCDNNEFTANNHVLLQTQSDVPSRCFAVFTIQ